MKREVKVISLSYSQSQIGSYIAVLSEVNGFRKLPIVIKTHDAQIIALKIEEMESARPNTHDIIRVISNAFNLDCQESYIYKVLEGIFYSTISFSNGIDNVDIESSCGDAIISSLNFNCPLYVSEEVLDTCGIVINEDGEFVSDERNDEKIVSVEDLKSMMEEAVENEDFEMAAELRDKIYKRSGGLDTSNEK